MLVEIFLHFIACFRIHLFNTNIQLVKNLRFVDIVILLVQVASFVDNEDLLVDQLGLVHEESAEEQRLEFRSA